MFIVLEQVQNFPQLVIKFILKNIRTASNPASTKKISAGRALKERQCTLKGQAWYVNVRGSVHWKGVYRVGDRDLGVQNFFNWFLKLTNQRRPKVTCLVRHLD